MFDLAYSHNFLAALQLQVFAAVCLKWSLAHGGIY